MQIPEIKISVSFSPFCLKSELRIVKTSSEVATVLREIFNPHTFEIQEEFLMVCINNASKVTGFFRVSTGGMTGTVADPKTIFTVAINCLATRIIIAHSHPSGSLKPSQADEELTVKIREAGKMLDIKVIDHIIIGDLTQDAPYYSFADEGMM